MRIPGATYLERSRTDGLSDDLTTVHLGGCSGYGALNVAVLKGAHSKKIAELLGHDYGSEVVHRNNLVVV